MAKKRASMADNMRVKKRAEAVVELPQKKGASLGEAVARVEEARRHYKEGWTGITIHMQQEMLDRLRVASIRRVSKAGYGRPNVSKIVREILERHADEIDD